MKSDSTLDPEKTLAEEVDSGGCAPMPGSAVRELMLAVEYMRSVCEHAEGRRKLDQKMLSRAMSVGTRINARHKHLLDDYQKATFWDEVALMPSSVGLPNAKRIHGGAGQSKQPETPTPLDDASC